jgi:hypothetical protein
MRNDIVTDEFVLALKDYAYLLDRQYPRKSILKTVGDRYMLNSFQRILLARGVFPESDVARRIHRTKKNIRNRELYIDGYNVLFTICNYLLGRLLFIGNDRFLRDAGEVYGKPHDDPVFSKAVDLCLEYLKKAQPGSAHFYLDRPISHSAELAGNLRERLVRAGIDGSAGIEKNPDARLIRQGRGAIVSSDSDILDHTELPVIDLAHLVLRDRFELRIPDLGDLLE